MQTTNKSYYLFRVYNLPNRYDNTCHYVTQTLAPQTSDQTTYEVLRGTNGNVYLYIKVAPTDFNTVSKYINANKYLQRIQTGASDKANYDSIIKTEFQRYNGKRQMQNMQMNMNPMMMQHNNNINIHQINNNQINQMMMMQQQRQMNQMMMMQQQQMQMNNNFINQQNKQNKINILKGLNSKNCNTQHINNFFNKETILEKIKDRQTIHPANKNIRKSYLDWFSEYVNEMYFLINNCAFKKPDKKKCWQEAAGNENGKITFSENTTEALLKNLIQTDFLNNRNPVIDGRNLIKDINDTMKYLAQCSLKIYNGQINVRDINRIIAVYDQLREYVSANPQAFVDRGVLGLGTDRDNAFREVVNDNVKVKNLKNLVVGLIGLVLG